MKAGARRGRREVKAQGGKHALTGKLRVTDQVSPVALHCWLLRRCFVRHASHHSFRRTPNPPFEVGPAGQIYLGKMQEFFFANSEFILAIRDPKLARRGPEYILDMAQYRGLFFYFCPRKLKIYLTRPTLNGGFNVLHSLTHFTLIYVIN